MNMKNLVQPTQTPWIVGGGAIGGSTMGVYCDLGEGQRIADCAPEGSTIDRSEARANAVLMAAAPDLLAALKQLELHGHTQATWHNAKAAIAKAERP
jgi:hypothetical protein